MPLTKAQRKALEILRDLPDTIGRHRTYGAQFAHLMWPDSPGWEKWSHGHRNGTAKATGIKRAGGAYLARLEKQGWVRTEFNTAPFSYTTYYSITDAGRKALEEES